MVPEYFPLVAALHLEAVQAELEVAAVAAVAFAAERDSKQVLLHSDPIYWDLDPAVADIGEEDPHLCLAVGCILVVAAGSYYYD